MIIYRRPLLLLWIGIGLGVSLTSCSSREPLSTGRLTIGIVAYESGASSVEQFEQFSQILGEANNSIVELEPAFNERKALAAVERQSWSLVFASPGLTAIALDQHRYIPLFPRPGNLIRSVLITQSDTEIESLADLGGQVVALGQVGSATGYYLPLYDLYGLTLEEIRTASTPRQVLDWVQQGEVAAGALAKDEYDDFRRQGLTEGTQVLHTSRPIPPGSVLLGPNVERNQQELISRTMNQIPPAIAETVGYVPNADPPDYADLIELVRKVQPLEDQIRDSPVRVFESN